MATPYRYTPRAPAAPRPTPISATNEGSAQRRTTRAPTVNPFERFTQNEFESWIAGITGALRSSLGQDVDVGQPAPQDMPAPQPVAEGVATDALYKPVGTDTEEDYDDYFEDSFADIKARRASSKGKGRDPLEGPGLHIASGRQQDEPIEVESGSDVSEEAEFEEYEDHNENYTLPKHDGESEEDEGDAGGVEQYEDDEGSQDFVEDDEYGAGSPHRASPKDFATHREEILRAMSGYGLYEDAREYEEYGSSDGDEAPNQQHKGRQASPEVIELDLDDDDDDLQPVSNQSLKVEGRELPHTPSPPIEDENGQDVLDDDEEFYHYQNAIERVSHRKVEDMGAEKIFVDTRGEAEVQPLNGNDAAFPPRTRDSVEAEYEAPDIRDPWSGPRVYAEDFYSGGDRPFRHGQVLDAHHIEDGGVETLDRGEDGIFVPEEPDQDERPTQLQLRDVWEGPETFAEDYYSAGSLNPGQMQAGNPDRLGHELLDGEVEVIEVDDDDEGAEGPDPDSLTDPRAVGPLALSPPGVFLVTEQPSDRPASPDAFQGPPYDGIDAVAPVAELEGGLTASDTEFMDADLDLEYPELSRAASIGAEATPLEVAPHPVAYQETFPLIEDSNPLESPENDAQGVVPAESRHAGADTDRGNGPLEEEHIVTDVADGVPSSDEDRTSTEDGRSAAISLEETGPCISYEAEGGAHDSEAGNDVMVGVKASRSSFEVPDDQANEANGVGHHAAEEVGRPEFDTLLESHNHSIAPTAHQTVILEAVANEDVENPTQAFATPDIIVGGGDDGDVSVFHGEEVASGELLWDEIAGNEGVDDHDDEDAYGEPENEDIEVLSVSSSEDFLVLAHAEDGDDVEEPSEGDVTMRSDTEEEPATEVQTKTNAQDASPLVAFEGPVTSTTLLEAQDGVNEHSPGRSSPSPDPKGPPGDGLPVETGPPASVIPATGLGTSGSGDGEGSSAGELAFKVSPVESVNTLGQVGDTGPGLQVESSPAVANDTTETQDLGALASQEGEAPSSTQDESSIDEECVMADSFVSVRATSPPESLEEESVPTVPVEGPLGSEVPSEQLPSVAHAASARAATPEVTHPMHSASTFVSERHSLVSFAKMEDSSIAVANSSQVPTGSATPSTEPLTVDDQNIPDDEPSRTAAAQLSVTETTAEVVVESQESNKPSVDRTAYLQHIAEVEMEVDTGEQSGPETRSTIACSGTKPGFGEASEQTSGTQLDSPVNVEAPEVLVEDETLPPAREVSPPPLQPSRMSATQEPPTGHEDLDATAVNLPENPPREPIPKFRTISQPSSHPSTLEPVTKGSAAKRKREGLSLKTGPRGAAGSRKKSAKGKGKEKQMNDAHLDGEEIIALPRKRTKLTESHLASVGGHPRPPVSTSATSAQSGSSASSAARLLQPSSRASSVAPSEASGQTQPSPTTSKAPGFQRGPGGFVVADSQPQAPSPLLQTTSAAQRPFLHAHGKRKPLPLQTYRTMPAPAPVVQQAAVPPQNDTQLPLADSDQHIHARRSSAAQRSSIPPASPSSSHPPTSPQHEAPPQTPTASIGQLSQAPTPQGPTSGPRRTQSMKAASSTAHTPVTRSHCRFHRISLPKEELGPRIFFIVPGCSLTRYGVIEDEEVEDHGDATYEESERMVSDIETLGLDPYIIKVLKSLVGSEIMQQREIYYLPLPGESVVRQASTSTAHATSHASKGRPSGSAYPSISARGKVGDTTLEDLGISETDSDDPSSDDSDYNAKPVTRTKPTTRRGGAPRKPTKASNKRSRASVTQDPMQVEEAEEGRVGKKVKLDDPSGAQAGPTTSDYP